MTSTETAATPAKKQAGTQYVLLYKTQGSGTWKETTGVIANSADDAIRKGLGGHGGTDEAEYVAIPFRSWKPRKVTVTTKPVVTLEDA